MANGRRIGSIRWSLNSEGGGTADVFSVVDGDQAVQTSYEFEALEELPADLAKLIKEDGRSTGQVGG